jgi:hypothetical protein
MLWGKMLMPRNAVRILATALLLGPAFHHGFAQDREKVEEGRYALIRNDGVASKSGHSWTLWRLPDGGYELEDHLDYGPKAPDRVLLPYEKSLGGNLQGFLRESIQPSDFHVVYGPGWHLLALIVSGENRNHERRDALKCRFDAKRIECDSIGEGATLKLDVSRELFWWYRIPMFLRPWLPVSPGNATSPASAKVAMLSFSTGPGVERAGPTPIWSNRPHLEPVDLTVTSLGESLLVFSDRSLTTQKYKLDFHPRKGKPLSLFAWTDANGAILAAADVSAPGTLIALVEHKKYPDNALSAPAQPER